MPPYHLDNAEHFKSLSYANLLKQIYKQKENKNEKKFKSSRNHV